MLALIGSVIPEKVDAQHSGTKRKRYLIYAPNDVYAPNDPWTYGHVYRKTIGHGWKYYNCDDEERKRCSPYIHWNPRPEICGPRHPKASCICQQIDEVRQRVHTGSCKQKEFCIKTYYRSRHYPVDPLQDCPCANTDTLRRRAYQEALLASNSDGTESLDALEPLDVLEPIEGLETPIEELPNKSIMDGLETPPANENVGDEAAQLLQNTGGFRVFSNERGLDARSSQANRWRKSTKHRNCSCPECQQLRASQNLPITNVGRNLPANTNRQVDVSRDVINRKDIKFVPSAESIREAGRVNLRELYR